MKLYKHLVEQPFIVATGLAALVHSTWSLGTLFAGPQPDPAIDGIVQYAFWLIPALLIAFALDVGQIATSAEIRNGDRSVARFLTFVVLAGATYYLQWLYISHHMPLLALAPGVRDTWGGFATLIRDAAIWIVPALLPLSTTLYTLSGRHAPQQAATGTITDTPTETTALVPVEQAASAPVIVPQPVSEETEKTPVATTHFEFECPDCGWRRAYLTADSARNARYAHKKHCTGKRRVPMPEYVEATIEE